MMVVNSKQFRCRCKLFKRTGFPALPESDRVPSGMLFITKSFHARRWPSLERRIERYIRGSKIPIKHDPYDRKRSRPFFLFGEDRLD